MHFSQEFLTEKLRAIRECQQKAFERVPEIKVVAKKRLPKIKVSPEEKSTAKKVKEILTSRRVKEQDEAQRAKVRELKLPDLTGKISLKINSKTTIYINPGQDKDEAKAAWLKKHSTPSGAPEDYMKERLGYNYQF